MSLSVGTFKRVIHIQLASVIVISAMVRSAHALDFKIELPPQKGVVAPDDEVFFDEVLSVSEGQADSLTAQPAESMSQLPSPVPPKNLPQRWLPTKQNAGKEQAIPQQQKLAKSATSPRADTRFALPNMNSFPNPSCLKENVAFWKRVYSEVDTHEALIHDREDLDKVYANVRLGGGNAQRLQSMRLLKDHYRTTLLSLADKIDSPKQWTPAEKAIAKNFKPSEFSRSRLVQASENIRVQQGLKSRFNEGVQRSLQYLPTIKSILRNQNLPLDIAFLPHVESSYVNHAKSKVGAVGLWQLMPMTMQLLMGKNAVNKRTDPPIATAAAAKLLKQNFEATGSWPLALTAYNHGLAGVLRAVRNTSSSDLCNIIERYNSPSFRFASSNFYAQFVAAREVASKRYQELANNREVGRIVAPLIASREKGAL
jgi:membrane-bound lytic murein transglycosylase D